MLRAFTAALLGMAMAILILVIHREIVRSIGLPLQLYASPTHARFNRTSAPSHQSHGHFEELMIQHKFVHIGRGGPYSHPVSETDPKRICILIPTCARGQHWDQIEDSCLLQMPLSSLKKTLEPNFQYSIYVGYDIGDHFFDNTSTISSLHHWFKSFYGTEPVLITLRIENHLKKPGPVMNQLSSLAYADGCHYFYRINDDSEFITNWTSAFVEALHQFSPPLLGVVGPTCYDGNDMILTHDFVHRTHLDIFRTHYPPQLTDWFLDDWITHVYGANNTLKLPEVVVAHRLAATRYVIGMDARKLLPGLIEQGRRRIADFLQQKEKILNSNWKVR